MTKNLASIGRKTIALILAFVLSFGVYIGSTSLSAEEEMPVLTKEMFIEEVLTDNLSIIDLEEQLVQLNDDLISMPTKISGLGSIHSLVPEYNRIGKKILYTKKNNPELLELIFNMVIANPVDSPEDSTDAAELSNIISGLTPAEAGKLIISPMEYAKHNSLGDVLAKVGITTTTVSADQEYETFILPIFVGTRSIQSGIDSLEDGIVSAKGTISIGAEQLYNTVLSLTDLLEILNLTYETSKTNYDFAQEKYDRGLLTATDLKISYNSLITAQLNRDKMIRDIDNLKMRMSLMMGNEPNVLFTVKESESQTIELKTPYLYTKEALVQRSEIISLKRSIDDQNYKRNFIADIFSSDDNRYIVEQKQLELYKIQLEETEDAITVEIYKAYNDVLEKELALSNANAEVEDAYRQYKELAFNVELGFVTDNTLKNLNLLVTSAINKATTANREYLSAIESLYDGSSFGPGSLNGGGTSIE